MWADGQAIHYTHQPIALILLRSHTGASFGRSAAPSKNGPIVYLVPFLSLPQCAVHLYLSCQLLSSIKYKIKDSMLQCQNVEI